MLRKWILIFSLVLSLGLVWAQVPIFHEAVPTFTELPTGWTSNNVSGNPIMNAATGGYLLVDHVDEWVVSSAYDLSLYENVELTIKVATYGSGDNNPLTIDVSNDNGATWAFQSFVTDTPTSSTYISSGPFAVTTADTQVMFRFRRDAADGKGVRFREILLQGDPLGAVPILAVNPETLSGFTYEENNGPSAEQSFTVSGTDLDGNVSISAPTNYEISLTSGSGFTTALNINHSGGTVAETNVYARLIAGLAVGNYNNETVSITAGTAVPKSVTLNGNVTAEPYEGGYLVNFDGPTENKGGYASGTINLSGLDWDMTEALTGNLASDFFIGVRSARFSGKATSSMTMLADKTGGLGTLSFQYRRYGTDGQVAWKVEYSTDGGTAWNQIGEAFTATADVQTFSSVVNVPGNVRLKISLVTDSGTSNKRMNIDDILLTDYESAGDPIINVSGEIDPLTNIAGMPSEELGQYTLSGENLMSNIQVTAPSYFELASDTSGPWLTELDLLPAFSGTVYVRLNGSVIGTHSGDITHSSTGADDVSIRVEGETFAPDGEIVINSSMTSFTQNYPDPSPVQSYSLSGSNLTGDTAVETSAPFELSLDGNSAWGQTLNVPYNFNNSIYVRLNGTTAGNYDNVSILHTNSNASPDSITVSGTIITPPAANLFISEYIEGGSNNKALEIYNASDAAVDLANFKLVLYSNGSSTPGNTLEMEGTLSSGAVYVTVNSGSIPEILALGNSISTVTYFNGDDAIALVHIPSGDTLDVVGTVGYDPGTAWDVAGTTGATLNHTLIRKATVIQGNTDWETQQGTNEADSEWIVMEQDYIGNLGSHTYNPGGNPMAAAPTFDPPAGAYMAPINVALSSSTPDATIRYTTDGSEPSSTVGTIYSTPIPVSTSTTIKAIAYAPGFDPSIVVQADYAYPVSISDIATLRTQPTGSGHVYTLTGEAVLTYQNANRNTKYIQDATAAIVIDDNNGIISTTYNLYDGITGISGYLNLYSGLLQFVPTADPGAATSSNNVIVPEVRTLASLTSADQAKLIKVMGATITHDTMTQFPSNAANLLVSDASIDTTLTLRTFYNTDYAGTDIPTDPVTLTCLVGQYFDAMQVSPRFLSDIETGGGALQTPAVSIVRNGSNVDLSWPAVDGANSYRVESSNDPYSGFTTHGTASTNAYSVSAADAKKFFRVIALP